MSELEENSQRDNCQIQHSIDRLLGNDSANDFLSIDDKILSIESTDQEIVDCVLGIEKLQNYIQDRYFELQKLPFLILYDLLF